MSAFVALIAFALATSLFSSPGAVLVIAIDGRLALVLATKNGA